ncbi:TetR/AcrR family transcriptional regulator [Microbacterium sp. M3]|uniref:TetR/AcrR family transcriptional regulator n=1 Tax=Microbacterium arthrosphaerae TaxID=792652 RepID=A0ABU4H4H2_9MICO|nr:MULTISPECIES: TetR/AcrR family transcriptional regulator [Microbacterium]MDW4574236.1 TetR/AcrR family transcriptional regulator [Microbacterium arthrosphaerae]MDW7608091.1 TetR/AcrR family transcriptional regulator [Microbacterium sp. M3]
MQQIPDASKRRRSAAQVEAAAHAATIELLIAGGPAAVTMEAVAQRIGTSKPVLYRRWPDSAALTRDALLTRAKMLIPPPDTGSLRGDIRSVLTQWSASFATPAAALYPVIIGVMAHDSDFAEGFRSSVIAWRRDAMHDIFARAAQRGEVDGATPIDIVSELGQAVLWHRLLITGDPVDEAFVDRLLDEVILPLAGGSSAHAPDEDARHAEAASPGPRHEAPEKGRTTT